MEEKVDRSEGKVGRRLVSFLGFGLTGYVKNVSQLMHCLVCKILLISLIIFLCGLISLLGCFLLSVCG